MVDLLQKHYMHVTRYLRNPGRPPLFSATPLYSTIEGWVDGAMMPWYDSAVAMVQ